MKNGRASWTRCIVSAVGTASFICVALGVPAKAADIKVLSTTGVQEVAESLGAKFATASGHKLAFVFAASGDMRKRLAGGEAADVVILQTELINVLLKEGRIAGDAVSPIAVSSVGVAVRRGTPRPDISSPEAFRKAMLAAKAVVTGDPLRGGTGAMHLFNVFENLGIAAEMKPRLVYKKVGGAAGNAKAMAETDADVAVGQLSEFATVSTMEIVGPLPGQLNLSTQFAAAVMRGARNPDAATALVEFMRTPDAAAEIRSQGMTPAFATMEGR